MSKKICISGYYGFNNFGDETILKILTQNLKEIKEKPQITVFSSNPQKTADELNVNSVHSFNLRDIFKQIRNCDCLISGGGSLLQDSTSAKSLIYYLSIIFLAQLFRKKTIIFAQGLGPIKNKFLLNSTMKILKKANYITVRDINSLNLLKQYNINANLCNDPVWNLEKTKIENTPQNKIGIQLRSFQSISDNFINELAFLINKHYSNKEINIYSLQNNLDLEICNRLKTKLIEMNSNLNINLIENTSNEKIIKDISNLDEFIAMRYHACLIAIKNNIKLLPISYDIKVETLAKDFNLTYIDLKNTQNLTSIFENFIKNNIQYDEEKIKNLYFDFKKLKENI